MPVVRHEVLRRLSADIFVAAGVPKEDARTIGDHLVESDLRGRGSHGVWRIRRYVGDIQGRYVGWEGHEVLRETRCLAVIDGRGCNGVVALTHAAEMAVGKASESTFGAVGLHHITHVGSLGDPVRYIAERDMMGIVWSNAAGIFVAPFGSADRRVGPNPIAFAVPRRKGPPFVLDISLSAVAGTKIRQKMERKEPLPDGWVVDQQGNYVTDSQRYDDPDVALLPLGGLDFGHKGHGLSMMVEMIAGPLSHAGTTIGQGAGQGLGAGKNGGGFFVMAIDVEAFTDLDAYKDQVEGYVEWVTSARPLPGVERVFVKGGVKTYQRGVDVQRLCQGNGPAIMSVVAVSSQ